MNRAQKLKLARELDKKQKELLNLVTAGMTEMDTAGEIKNYEAYISKVKALRDETLKMQTQLNK